MKSSTAWKNGFALNLFPQKKTKTKTKPPSVIKSGPQQGLYKMFFKKPSTWQACARESYMNHTDTETYTTYSCLALCSAELHTGVCSGVKVIEPRSVRAPARIRPVKDGAKPDPGRSSSVATFEDHASASNDGYQIVCRDILSFLAAWSVIYFKGGRMHLTKCCSPLFSGWNCKSLAEADRNRILLLLSSSVQASSTASLL